MGKLSKYKKSKRIGGDIITSGGDFGGSFGGGDIISNGGIFGGGDIISHGGSFGGGYIISHGGNLGSGIHGGIDFGDGCGHGQMRAHDGQCVTPDCCGRIIRLYEKTVVKRESKMPNEPK